MPNDNNNTFYSSPPKSLTSEAGYIANEDYIYYDFDRYVIYSNLVTGEKVVLPYSEKSCVKKN